jgi:hypothetical protein
MHPTSKARGAYVAVAGNHGDALGTAERRGHLLRNAGQDLQQHVKDSGVCACYKHDFNMRMLQSKIVETTQPGTHTYETYPYTRATRRPSWP